jgi:hypothetical protein
MAKKFNTYKSIHEPMFKKTSQAARKGSLKTSSMNKHKRRSHKLYRGQGK